jgi:hypothetical protein
MIPRPKISSLSTIAGLFLFAVQAFANASATKFTESGVDFKAGQLGNSGQNLYVNSQGALEVIRRSDLDDNGHLDLLFNSTHDRMNNLPSTLATVSNSEIQYRNMDIGGSSKIVASDLNQDGLVDLVYMPNQQNVQKQRSSIKIAWGSAEGWTSNLITRQLPVNGVISLSVNDLNRDGWPDILTLNGKGWTFGQPQGNIVRIYWGSPDGFFLTKYQDIGIEGAVEIATGLFGSDQNSTAVVTTEKGALFFYGPNADATILQQQKHLQLPLEKDMRVQAMLPQSNQSGDVLWLSTNTKTAFYVSSGSASVGTFSSFPATHLALGYLDDDNSPDLVFTNQTLIYPSAREATPPSPSVHILWGTSGLPDASKATSLSLDNANATAIGDLNQDGHGDLVVSIFQGTQSQKAESKIFLGNGSRSIPTKSLDVPTEGSKSVSIAKVSANEQPNAIFANSQYRTLDDAVPLRLYWGIKGGFSRDTFVDIPNLSGYKSSASDLNGDGYVDIIVINGADISEESAARAPHTGINIYWGGPTGDMPSPGPTKFDFSRRQVLPEKHLGSINVADLNKDGYLDIVLGAFESANTPDTQIIIYYGSAEGYSSKTRQSIDVIGRSIGCLIADYNRDGFLDITIGSFSKDKVIIYWGSKGDYRNENKTVLPYSSPIDLEAADFNNDGWLDLIVASYYDSVTHNHDTGSSIFWGSAKGWHQSRSQWLPGMTPLGLAVADLDSDGYLDLVSPSYHGELTREQIPSYIFWGTAEGFTPRNRTSLIVDSASGVVIADFNGDGKLDLAFSAHSIDPGHLLESPVFYNDGNRFSSPEVQHLPADGPHYMWVQDIGNIYTRSYEEIFTSQTIEISSGTREVQITIDATTPHYSSLSIEAKSADTLDRLDAADWHKVKNGVAQLAKNAKVLQYRLTLQSKNGDAYPLVREVHLKLQ